MFETAYLCQMSVFNFKLQLQIQMKNIMYYCHIIVNLRKYTIPGKKNEMDKEKVNAKNGN
jgi:hypothetical protein